MAYGKDELKRALETYRAKNPVNNFSSTPTVAQPTATQATTTPLSFDDRRNQLVDRMMQQTQAQPPQMTAPAPYQGFNPNDNAPYQAALREAQRNARAASGNAMVQMGARGIGNSSMTTDRVAQIQQNALGRVSDTLLPQYETMDYGRYRDQVGDQFRVDETNYARGQDQYNRANDLARFMADLSQRDLDNERTIAGITGQFRGQNTLEQRQANLNALERAAALTGQMPQEGPKDDWRLLFEGGRGGNFIQTSQQVQQDWDNAFKEGQVDWQKAQQAWENAFQEKNFQRQMEEAAASRGLQWASLNQREREFVADQAYREKRFEWEKQQAEQRNNINIMDEAQGLVNALRSGQVDPARATIQIDEDVQLGFYTPEEANQLKSVVQTLTPNLSSSQPRELTPEQQKQIPTNQEIDKIWETVGKEMGAGLLDFRTWFKDPNGRPSGVDFKTWKQLYGPRIN